MSFTLNSAANQGLTAAQLAALKTDINANTNTVTFIDGANGQVVVQIKNTNANSGAAADAVAAWYNLPCAVNFFANYSTVPLSDIKGAIIWKNLTPKDAVPTTPDLAVQVWNARTIMCSACQFNVQMLLTPSSAPGQVPTIDATQSRVVTGFTDALSAVPSDTAGAVQDAGAINVQKVLCRLATNLEKLFADVTNGNGSTNLLAAKMVIEGGAGIIGQTIVNARL